MRKRGCLAWAALALSAVFVGSAQAMSNQPQGFRFRDGYLLKWGASTSDLKAHFRNFKAPVELEAPPVACNRDGSACFVNYEHYDTLPLHLTPPKGWNDALVFDPPFHFVNDQFYGVSLPIRADFFEILERSMIAALGRPSRRKVGAAQNAYGAVFSTVTDIWLVSHVKVELDARTTRADEGFFEMTYLPLEKEAPKRHPETVAPPF